MSTEHSKDQAYLFRFWAKTSKDKKGFHPLPCHLLDVAAVTLVMWDRVLPDAVKARIAQAFGKSLGESRALVAWLAGLHDLGKASPPFVYKKAAKYLGTLYEGTDFSRGHLGSGARNLDTVKTADAPHGYITAFTLPPILSEFGLPKGLAEQVAELIGGHHGIFAATNYKRRLKPEEVSNELRVGNQPWQTARRDLVYLLADVLGVPRQQVFSPALALTNSTLMILAGLVSVADWIGSNTTYFRCRVAKLEKRRWRKLTAKLYFNRTILKAHRALTELGWLDWPQPDERLSFEQLFSELRQYPKKPVQRGAETVSDKLNKAGLVIIEERMGEGKTEAAILIADQWNHRLKQRGIYFALPTMATSNQMFRRVCNFLSARFPGKQIPVLLQHGHATLTKAYLKLLDRSEKPLAIRDIFCEDHLGGTCAGELISSEWFTQRKHGLLMPFGVGTVDQALMAALKTRHVFVRLFGLAHRTVIIDEVHAYDAYMSALLERLLEWLGALESPVVLLSATLPSRKRQALVEAYARGMGHFPGEQRMPPLPEAKYPRITWITDREPHVLSLREFAPAEQVSRQKPELLVEWVDGRLPDEPKEFPLGERLLERLKEGGCAAVICSTVDRAQEMFERLAGYFKLAAKDGPPAPKLDLFHARFLFEDREVKENLALRRFGKDGKKIEFGERSRRKVKRPQRFVLVATQVIEQSLDLDFDLIVSDFAPVDLILQRVGRIWRHEGNKRYSFSQPTLWLCRPEMDGDVPRFDKGTEAVYAPDDGTGRGRNEQAIPHVLLRSWLALCKLKATNGLDDSFTLDISADIEPLVEEAYAEVECPDDLPEGIRASWRESKRRYDESIAAQRGQADYKMLPSPTYRNHISGFFQDAKEEDAPEIHQAHQALTRLGDSINVVCLENLDGFNLKAEPNAEQAKEMIRHSVSISRRDVVRCLRREGERLTPEGWRKSPWLRHYKLIQLGHSVAGNQFQVAEYQFHYDSRLGLRVEKVGKGER